MAINGTSFLGKNLMHFGSGPRQCPGMQLSLMEIKHALITMLKQFTFSADKTNASVESHFAFTVMPKNLNVIVRKNPTENYS